MVNTVYLDCRRLGERREAHAYLAEVMKLPKYYGRNLDALYDCLMEYGECVIVLEHAEVLAEEWFQGGYGGKLLKVLREAGEGNERLELKSAED